MNRDLLLLRSLARFDDHALLALRLLTGAFLAREMWFNISDADTMKAVIGYFADNGFSYPEIFAPLSAWAQFLIGIALILGLLTRWAGVLLAFNFVVGIVMVHWHDSFRDQWPALALLAIGLVFATLGGGPFSLDEAVAGKRRSRDLLLLRPLARLGDIALLALRLLTGTFLIHGVWDNIVNSERMSEFTGFLAANGFDAPTLMAPLSVYAQFVVGLALIAGALTRWARLLLSFNFAVAIAMVHWGQSFRESWPALVLVALGFLFAAIGGGRISTDRWIER